MRKGSAKKDKTPTARAWRVPGRNSRTCALPWPPVGPEPLRDGRRCELGKQAGLAPSRPPPPLRNATDSRRLRLPLEGLKSSHHSAACMHSSSAGSLLADPHPALDVSSGPN